MSGFARTGSQRWLQIAVNRKPDVLLAALRRSGAIGLDDWVTWRSPLEQEDCKEYRDEAALEKVGIKPADLRDPLPQFWPARGPVWDALAINSQGHSLFLEAKAHIPEAASPATKATEKSLMLISKSLEQARRFYAPKATATWSSLFYQYANRLAHHYFLKELNGLTSSLVFLYFLNAEDMLGPMSEEEWHGAMRLIHAVLGLPKDITHHGVFDAFLDVKLLQ